MFPTCLPLYFSPVCSCIIYRSVDFLLLLLLVYNCIPYMYVATSLVRLYLYSSPVYICIIFQVCGCILCLSVAVFFTCVSVIFKSLWRYSSLVCSCICHLSVAVILKSLWLYSSLACSCTFHLSVAVLFKSLWLYPLLVCSCII